MKKFALLSFLTLITLSLNAREAQLLTENNYKYQVAKKVFDKLIEAKGDKRLQVPEFIMSKGKRYVAWMDNKKSQIGLEETAYNVCVSFGKDSLNAMAALIGHEITHYYEKHSWGNDFATAFTDLGVSGTVKTTTKSTELKTMNETEADYLGGFLAYSAGFQTFGVMPKFLVDVYAAYELPNQIPGYPSLDDRSQLAVEAEMKLEALIHAFEAANYMIVLQQHDVVNDYYTFILKEFQSREIYNNAGVNAVMAALQLFEAGDEQLKYAYPIQLDGETRMKKPKGRGDALGFAEKAEQRTRLLQQAKYYFEQANALDPAYSTALINLACVQDLLGNYEDAGFIAKKAVKLAEAEGNAKVVGDAYIIRGIATIHEGEPTEGLNFFKKAVSKNSGSEALAQLNTDIYNGIAKPEPAAKPKISLTKEKLDNVSLDEFMASIDVDNLMEITAKTSLGVKQLTNSTILLNLIDGGQTGFTLLQLTNDRFDGATGDGVRMGDAKSVVLQKYGQPTYIQEARQGQFLVYDFKQIAFFVNNDLVHGWALYRTKAE